VADWPEEEDVGSLADVFRVINEARQAGVISDYAVGGAMAVLFYAEPARTYDLDIFVLLPTESGVLVSLAPIYDWARHSGFPLDAEHILIHGVPVQFLPAHNALTEAAVREARDLDYEGVPVRVVTPEHLVAMALETGGAKRRERIAHLLEAEVVDPARLAEILTGHGLDAAWRRYRESFADE
jgi:hypothetical protein